MKRVVLIAFALTLLAALVPTAAFAKGASQAEITGPGLHGSIALKAGGLRSKLGKLAEATGFYAAVFSQSPDPMLDERPAGDLGPRYTITYVMPGPNNESDRLVQEVYPYAKPAPVTHVESGQPFFGTEQTRGGWFVATSSLKDVLVAAGLPANAPVAGGGDDGGFPTTLVAVLAGLIGAVMLLLLAGRRRRRPGAATA